MSRGGPLFWFLARLRQLHQGGNASPPPPPPPAPVAAFSGTPLSGTAPLNVTFTDASTNSPTGWDWDFGDGGSSNAKNPSHSFGSPGSYTISLDASNASGSDNETKVGYVTVSAAPPPPPGGTWREQRKLMINVNPQDDFNQTKRYRNLARAPRAQSSTFYGDVTDVTLKTSGADKGYPVSGTTFGSVYQTQMSNNDAGAYKLSVKGNNPFVNKGDGSLSGGAYDSGTNRYTATITFTPPVTDALLAIGWNAIGSTFGALEVMQPGFNPGDTEFLTDDAQTHYGIYPVLRFMDLLDTNNQGATEDWVGSSFEGADSFDRYKNSLGAAFDIANELDAEAWVNVPAMASMDFLVNSCTYCDSRTAPDKKFRKEWQNEPWNFRFPAHGIIMAATFDAAQLCSGNDGSNTAKLNRTDRRITESTRSGTTVTTKLNFNPATVRPGITAGSQIYYHGDKDGAIAPGLFNLTSVNNLGGGQWSVVFTHGSSGSATANLDATWFESYIYLDPANELCVPATSVTFSDNPRPNPRGIKAKYEMREGLRPIYEAAVFVGCEDKIRIIKGIQLEGDESWFNERHGLGFALDQGWGLSWLFANGGGLFPAIYLRPDDGHVDAGDLDTVDGVFDELEDRRVDVRRWVTFFTNMLGTLGQEAVDSYEGGAHTDYTPNSTVRTAVRSAHLDARMGTLMENLYQDWANRSRGGICYYYGGSGTAFTSGNSTWPLIEGGISGADLDQPKNAAQLAIADTEFAATPIDGVNSGTIRPADVAPPVYGEELPGNGIFKILNTTALPPLGHGFDVWADADDNYTITLRVGSTVTGSDQVAMFVDEVQRGAAVNLPSYSNGSTKPAVAVTRTLDLDRGWHRLRFKLDDTRDGTTGLSDFTFNPS